MPKKTVKPVKEEKKKAPNEKITINQVKLYVMILKNRKSSGIDNILNELIKYGLVNAIVNICIKMCH